jgi:hypothetical protein
MSASDQPIVHTPGPWSLLCSEARGGPRCLVVCPKDNEIASINPFRESWSEDAELIAAAPDLLAACKSFLDMWHRAGPLGSHQFEKFDSVVRQCSMAVDKATGEVV